MLVYIAFHQWPSQSPEYDKFVHSFHMAEMVCVEGKGYSRHPTDLGWYAVGVWGHKRQVYIPHNTPVSTIIWRDKKRVKLAA